MLLKIVLGLVGLGIVVFVHELGHFIAARLSGIDVEAFSIGWGRPIYSKKIGKVEYRLGIFPIGGYCKMRGAEEFAEALSKKSTEIPREKGTFYGASPLKRIFTAFAGPFSNILFAILVLSFVWGFGFEVQTLDNKIVLASDIDSEKSYPATDAGLKTGDRIIEIDGNPVSNYTDIQEHIAPNPGKTLELVYERDGAEYETKLVPELDPASGAGKIGIYFWTDPLIEKINPESPAAIAGLRSGDRIVEAQGIDIPYSVALSPILEQRPNTLVLAYERDGTVQETELVLSYAENGTVNLGIEFAAIRFHTGRLSVPAALAKGAQETWKTFTLSIKSLGLLFKGVDLTQAVSGPVRITYMVGDIATEGFGQGFGTGLSSLASFLSLISIALCIMNLLPIPALDGGMILIFSYELIRRKPLHPRFLYIFQMLGASLIFALLLFSIFGDILFLLKR